MIPWGSIDDPLEFPGYPWWWSMDTPWNPWISFIFPEIDGYPSCTHRLTPYTYAVDTMDIPMDIHGSTPQNPRKSVKIPSKTLKNRHFDRPKHGYSCIAMHVSMHLPALPLAMDILSSPGSLWTVPEPSNGQNHRKSMFLPIGSRNIPGYHCEDIPGYDCTLYTTSYYPCIPHPRVMDLLRPSKSPKNHEISWIFHENPWKFLEKSSKNRQKSVQKRSKTGFLADWPWR